jgi:Xaa-Pro aminopeptidase
VEVSRAIAARDAELSADTEQMLEAYLEYADAARSAMRPGASCHDVHRAVSRGFTGRGYHLGHVTGHSIGMTMIEFPKIGEGVETELAESMVFSMHPHAIAENGEDCLYMQDTWLVTAEGGVQLATLPMQVFRAQVLQRDVESERELAVARVARPRGAPGDRGREAAPGEAFRRLGAP